jgi:hypothetical protein
MSGRITDGRAMMLGVVRLPDRDVLVQPGEVIDLRAEYLVTEEALEYRNETGESFKDAVGKWVKKSIARRLAIQKKGKKK